MLKIRSIWKAAELKRFKELERKHHYMGETGKCEMPAGRRLLEEADLTNALVSSDALHCQQDTARAIAASNGESLMQIKANQKGLLRNAETVARARDPVASKKN